MLRDKFNIIEVVDFRSRFLARIVEDELAAKRPYSVMRVLAQLPFPYLNQSDESAFLSLQLEAERGLHVTGLTYSNYKYAAKFLRYRLYSQALQVRLKTGYTTESKQAAGDEVSKAFYKSFGLELKNCDPAFKTELFKALFVESAAVRIWYDNKGHFKIHALDQEGWNYGE